MKIRGDKPISEVTADFTVRHSPVQSVLSTRFQAAVGHRKWVIVPQEWIFANFFEAMKQMHHKELSNLLAMSAPDRYALFVRRVADWQEVWSLRTDEGWCLKANDDGLELIPVWPHERLANACAGTKRGERAAPISLDDWLNKWIPGMLRDGRQIAVFPVPSGAGIVISPERLRDDLLAECEQYE